MDSDDESYSAEEEMAASLSSQSQPPARQREQRSAKKESPATPIPQPIRASARIAALPPPPAPPAAISSASPPILSAPALANAPSASSSSPISPYTAGNPPPDMDLSYFQPNHFKDINYLLPPKEFYFFLGNNGKLSFIDIAYLMLRETRRAMHAKQIIEWAYKRDWFYSIGQTPWLTISSLINSDMGAKKDNSLFVRVDKGIFGLKELAPYTLSSSSSSSSSDSSQSISQPSPPPVTSSSSSSSSSASTPSSASSASVIPPPMSQWPLYISSAPPVCPLRAILISPDHSSYDLVMQAVRAPDDCKLHSFLNIPKSQSSSNHDASDGPAPDKRKVYDPNSLSVSTKRSRASIASSSSSPASSSPFSSSMSSKMATLESMVENSKQMYDDLNRMKEIQDSNLCVLVPYVEEKKDEAWGKALVERLLEAAEKELKERGLEDALAGFKAKRTELLTPVVQYISNNIPPTSTPASIAMLPHSQPTMLLPASAQQPQPQSQPQQHFVVPQFMAHHHMPQPLHQQHAHIHQQPNGMFVLQWNHQPQFQPQPQIQQYHQPQPPQQQYYQ